MPVLFWMPGNDPSEWYGDIENAVPEHVALGQQLGHYDNHIKANDATLKRNSGYFKWGARLGICAPIIGLMMAGITCLVLSNVGKL